MLDDEQAQLSDELGVAAEGEIGLDPSFDRLPTSLLEVQHRVTCERLVFEVCQSGAAPEG